MDMVTTTETVLALPEGCYDAVSLTLPPGLTFEQWAALGNALQNVEKSTMFWIGDWLTHGEMYGEQASQYMDRYSYKTIQNARWVSKQIPPSRRRESLSYSHHADVAGMLHADQDYWLSRAHNEGLSLHAMRDAIRAEKAAKEIPADEDDDDDGDTRTPRKSLQKNVRQEAPKLLKASRGRDCINCGSPNAVAAHYCGVGADLLGNGGALKCHDICTAELCDVCHKKFDQYVAGNDYERGFEFLMLIVRTIVRRIEVGDIKVA